MMLAVDLLTVRLSLLVLLLHYALTSINIVPVQQKLRRLALNQRE